ncbi:MAG: hypothetical protein JWN45_93, partial [Acidobacteriaceae bacterium]|nr:hypothetical protein [Acidobacteriaceae bacterium]
MRIVEFKKLLCYPNSNWGQSTSDRWISLCTGLREYEVPCRSFAINRERKWELVSAFQKAIRRGEKQIALRLASAIDSMPEGYAYFWRRLCVIACEDVGPGDDTLSQFVVACATVFSPKRTGPENYRLFCFLSEEMCELSARSRVYCSYETVNLAIANGVLPKLQPEDRIIVEAIVNQKEAVEAANTRVHEWQKKNNWRAGGLLKFVGLALREEMEIKNDPVPASRMLFDLPSYCYDVYTRVGLTVLRRLVQGVSGAEGIREVFQQSRAKAAHRALGEALFTVEGGREQGELIYPSLCSL